MEPRRVFISQLERTVVGSPSLQQGFMGFGYNPDLTRGENLDMLEYFSWMSRLGGSWTLWDASSFAIVNKARFKPLQALGDRPLGEDILCVLLSELERPKRRDLVENCDRRREYLQAFIEITGIPATYVDARDVFANDTRAYGEALDTALEWFWRAQREQPDLVNSVLPTPRTIANELYLPLEIAECLYLARQGVGVKYGPASEDVFDACIAQRMGELEEDYLTLRSPLGPSGKAAYLGGDGIRTSDCQDAVQWKLQNDEYRSFVASYMGFLCEPGEPLEETCVRTIREVSR